jgi:hypothetical protein
MHEEQQRAIRHARQAGTEAAIEALSLGLLTDLLLDLLPLDAERRVRQHVVELAMRVPVLGKRVAENDVGDVLSLDEHVGLADREGLGVQFLPVHGEPRLGVHGGQVLFGDRQHAARARRRVVDRANNARPGERLTVLDEDEVDHQAYDLARREMLTRRLVRQLRKSAG